MTLVFSQNKVGQSKIKFDTEKIKAHFENGVLEVRLPKSAEAKSRSKKISIS